MNYYPELASHIIDKVKVVLDDPTVVKLNKPTDVDTISLAANSDFLI